MKLLVTAMNKKSLFEKLAAMPVNTPTLEPLMLTNF